MLLIGTGDLALDFFLDLFGGLFLAVAGRPADGAVEGLFYKGRKRQANQ